MSNEINLKEEIQNAFESLVLSMTPNDAMFPLRYVSISHDIETDTKSYDCTISNYENSVYGAGSGHDQRIINKLSDIFSQTDIEYTTDADGLTVTISEENAEKFLKIANTYADNFMQEQPEDSLQFIMSLNDHHIA